MTASVGVELAIGCGTIFLSCIGSAVIIGIFVGGLKTEMRITSDRLAKIEGMFTLVPRQQPVQPPGPQP